MGGNQSSLTRGIFHSVLGGMNDRGGGLFFEGDEDLLTYIRELEQPELAVVDEDALLLVDSRFVNAMCLVVKRRHGDADADGDTGNETSGSGRNHLESSGTDIMFEARDAFDMERKATLAELERLSGKNQILPESLYSMVLFLRQQIVLEYVCRVLLERKRKMGSDDPFFKNADKVASSTLLVSSSDGSTYFDDSCEANVLSSSVQHVEGQDPPQANGSSQQLLSLRVLNDLYRSTLGALNDIGLDAALPVVLSLHSTIVHQFEELQVCSLRTGEMEDTMGFLLRVFDIHASAEAAETLFILALAVGSLRYMLELAVRLLREPRLWPVIGERIITMMSRNASSIAGMPTLGVNQETGDANYVSGESRRTLNRLLELKLWSNENNAIEQAEDIEERQFSLPVSAVTIFKENRMLMDAEDTDGVLFMDRNGHINGRIASPLFPPFLAGRIRRISCGVEHILACTEEGKIFAAGSDEHGQCGQGSKSRSISKLEYVDSLGDEIFVEVAAGDYHSVVLSKNSNHLYSFGKNSCGQLAIGNIASQPFPVKLSLPCVNRVITGIAAGGCHSAFLLDSQKIYGAGCINDVNTSFPKLLFSCEVPSSIVAIASSSKFCVGLKEVVDVQSASSPLPKENLTGKKIHQYQLFSCLQERESHMQLTKAYDFCVDRAIQLVATSTHLFVLLENAALESQSSDRNQLKALNSPPPGSFGNHLGTSDAGVIAILSGLDRFPVVKNTSTAEVPNLFIELMEALEGDPHLSLMTMRALQRHCLVSGDKSESYQASMEKIKHLLFRFAQSEVKIVREEAIRTISHGFAFLSLSTSELATFIGTITNMVYFARFATFKFWAETLSQPNLDPAFVLIDRLVCLSSENIENYEVLSLLMAVIRSLLLLSPLATDVICYLVGALSNAGAEIIRNLRRNIHEESHIHTHVNGDESETSEKVSVPSPVSLHRESTLEGIMYNLRHSLVNKLLWLVVSMLHHPKIDISGCISELLSLLAEVDALGLELGDFLMKPTGHWFWNLEWTIVFLLVEHVGGALSNLTLLLPNLDQAPILDPFTRLLVSRRDQNAGMVSKLTSGDIPSPSPINVNLFHSGICEREELSRRRDQFEAIVSDSNCVVMSRISRMNRVKFKNTDDSASVWQALRAVYAAIILFDKNNVKNDDEACSSAMKIITWIGRTRQSLPNTNYEEIARHVLHRVRFVLGIKEISEHSLFTFIQHYDSSQLEAYEKELERQRVVERKKAEGLNIFARMIPAVRHPSLLRHIIFQFTDYAMTCLSCNLKKKVIVGLEILIQTTLLDPDLSSNASLRLAALYSCFALEHVSGVDLMRDLLKPLEYEAARELEHFQGTYTTQRDANTSDDNSDRDTCSGLSTPFRDSQSMFFFPPLSSLPSSLEIQWSRLCKNPNMRLSKNGRCFQHHLHRVAGSGKSEPVDGLGGIQLTHSIHAGRYYFEFHFSPGLECPRVPFVFMVGIISQKHDKWNRFSDLDVTFFCVEQRVGLLVDMSTGIAALMRHDDDFYKEDVVDNDRIYSGHDSCDLTLGRILAAKKFSSSDIQPVVPAVYSICPGMVGLLRNVAFNVEIDMANLVSATSSSFDSLGNCMKEFTTGNRFGLATQSDQQGNEEDQQTDIDTNQASNVNEINVAGSKPEQDESEVDTHHAEVSLSGPLSLGISGRTELLVCGQNSYNELCLGDAKSRSTFDVSGASGGLMPVQVVAGNETTAVLTAQGEVYAWGYNRHGTCGNPSNNEFIDESDQETIDTECVSVPTRVDIPVFITRLACSNGSEHMLAISSCGRLYSWGFNQYGQLGLGHQYEKVLQPTLVERELNKAYVVHAAAGYSHSLVLTSDGTVYSFGLNSGGQLGLGSSGNMYHSPQRLNRLSEVGPVQAIACGLDHSAVVMTNGSLLTFGCNDFGQLGIDDSGCKSSPFPVPVADGLSKLGSMKCSAVACGYHFTIAIAGGALHSFGRNNFGQLGLGHSMHVLAPVPVVWDRENDHFVAIACGAGHSVAVSANGCLIAWGRNKDGGLGDGNAVDRHLPVEVCNKGDMSLSIRNQRPLHIAAGFHHTCVVVAKRNKSSEKSADFEVSGRHMAWPLRLTRSSVLVLSHIVSRSDRCLRDYNEAIENMIQWLIFNLMQAMKDSNYSVETKETGARAPFMEQLNRHNYAISSFELCTRHNAANMALCCLEDSYDTALTGWISGIQRAAMFSRVLYVNFLLRFMLLMLGCGNVGVSSDVYRTSRDILLRCNDLVSILFRIGLNKESPVQCSLAFQVLRAVLPYMHPDTLDKCFSVRSLLIMVGGETHRVVKNQVIGLLRTLLGTDLNQWSSCVGSAVLDGLSTEIPNFVADSLSFSCFSDRKEHIEAMIGSLQVLGASDEVLYNGAKVTVLNNQADEREGILEWYRPSSGFQDIICVSLDRPSTKKRFFLRGVEDIAPCSEVSVPIHKLEHPESILSLLTNLIQQSIYIDYGTDLSANAPKPRSDLTARALCLHEVAKARASRVIGTMLHKRSRMVEIFVGNGHLQAITYLLAAPRGSLDHLATSSLQKRFVYLMSLLETARFSNSSLLVLQDMKANRESKSIKVKSDVVDEDYLASIAPQRCRSSIVLSWNFKLEGLANATGLQVELKCVDSLTTSPDSTHENTSEIFTSETSSKRQLKVSDSLCVPANSYLILKHTFSRNGSDRSVYLNQYSIILDILIPECSMNGKSDAFIALLQTSLKNDSLADWYVRGDGSIGCVGYSAPAMVRADTWHRVVMVADLTNGIISYFIDGTKAVTLNESTLGSSLCVLEDDRWALEPSFMLFRDVNHERDAPPVYIANAQLRSYSMLDSDVRKLGGTNSSRSGIAQPSIVELAVHLSHDVCLPLPWCIQALNSTSQQLLQAKIWLNDHRQGLVARTVSEARILTALGYSESICTRALCTTGSLSGAIHWLLERDDESFTEFEGSISGDEIQGNFKTPFSSNLMSSLEIIDDDQSAYNRTYEIASSTQPNVNYQVMHGDCLPGNENRMTSSIWNHSYATIEESMGGMATNSHRIRPPLSSGMRLINAELWETARQLFIRHARLATVSVLEGSLLSSGSSFDGANPAVFGSDDTKFMDDIQKKMMNIDESGRSFLRNYLRAFPESIAMDIQSNTLSIDIDSSDPIQVLRRKLLLVFSREVLKTTDIPKLPLSAIDFSRAIVAWARQHGRRVVEDGYDYKGSEVEVLEVSDAFLARLVPGRSVWWISTVSSNEKSSDTVKVCTPHILHGTVVAVHDRSVIGHSSLVEMSETKSNDGNNAIYPDQGDMDLRDGFAQLATVCRDFNSPEVDGFSVKKGSSVLVLSATVSGIGRVKEISTGMIGNIPLTYVDAIGTEHPSDNHAVSDSSLKEKESEVFALNIEKRNRERCMYVEVKCSSMSNTNYGTEVEKNIFLHPWNLFLEIPPSDKEDSRLVKSLKKEEAEGLWQKSVMRALYEDLLHELVLLTRGPWEFLSCGLQSGPSIQLQDIWSDKLTRVVEVKDPISGKIREITQERACTVRIWRPFADSGFSFLGDVATPATATSMELDRPLPVTVVSDDDGLGGKSTTSSGMPLLASPVGFKLLWQSSQTDSDESVSFWQPIPPESYIAMGCIAVKGNSRKEPDLKQEGLLQLRCVHQSCVQMSYFRRGVWSRQTIDASSDSHHGLASGENVSAFTNWNHGRPSETKPKLSFLRKPSTDHQAETGAHHRRNSLIMKSPSFEKCGIALWEVDNGSKTFIPVLDSSDEEAAQSEYYFPVDDHGLDATDSLNFLTTNRADAVTIEARLCLGSQRFLSEVSKAQGTNGNHLSSLRSQTLTNFECESSYPTQSQGAVGDGVHTELRPYHLGLSSSSHSLKGSSNFLLWILQLFSEFFSQESVNMSNWAERVFSPHLVHALLRFSQNANPKARIKAIRMLAMVIRRTPATSLNKTLISELLNLRDEMLSLYKAQSQKPKDGFVDEMPLFSSLLCGLTEVFVSVDIANRLSISRPSDDTHAENPASPELHSQILKNEGYAKESTKQAFIEATFSGPMGLEILLRNELLVVHYVKANGEASSKNIAPGDIFWKLDDRRVSEYDSTLMWRKIRKDRPLKVTFLRDADVYRAAASRDYRLADTDMVNIASDYLGFDYTRYEDSKGLISSPDEVGYEASQPELQDVSDGNENIVNLTTKESWFQELSELAEVMDALLHRETAKMPNQFLMAEDTFLKVVLSKQTCVVESQHPFSLQPILGRVTIPGAEALVAHFDRRCSLPFGKIFRIKCQALVDNCDKMDEKSFSVENLQATFGGGSVCIPGDTMTYQFPVSEECSWAFHRESDYKGPDIRLSNSGRTATLRKDKVWQTVFSTVSFNSGINAWEVRIDRTGNSANIFFGVAILSKKVNNYLGSDDKGWGWIGCMACWHGGKKVRHRFGQRLKPGDIVRVTLDISRRAMSIARNGEDFGIAFNRLPLPSTIIEPGNELVPTFSFYNKDDQITLLSCSKPLDRKVAIRLHELRSKYEQKHAMAKLSSRFSGKHGHVGSNPIGGRSQRRQTRPRSNSRRRRGRGSRSDLILSGSRSSVTGSSGSSSTRRIRRSNSRHEAYRGTSRANEGTGVESIEEDNVEQGFQHMSDNGSNSLVQSETASSHLENVEELASRLSVLGYPEEWCLQALSATSNDINRAAEYLLSHADFFAEESRHEADRAAIDAENAFIAEEEEWFSQLSLLLDKTGHLEKHSSHDSIGTSSIAATALSTLESTYSTKHTIQREFRLDESSDADRSSMENLSTGFAEHKLLKGKKNAIGREWGYRMTISPLYSRENTVKFALEPQNARRLSELTSMLDNFTLRHDCDLVKMVNTLCSKNGEDPLTLSPSDFVPTKDDLAEFPGLLEIPILNLQLRFLLLRNFNRRLAHALPLIDLSCPDHESALASSLRSLRGVVLSSIKTALFERVLADSHSGDDHWMQQQKNPTVTLDRNRALQFLKTNRVDHNGTYTIFGQLFSQLHGNDGSDQGVENVDKNSLLESSSAVKDVSLLRNSQRSWYTILVGERADDYGGPYRDVFNQACQELLTPALPLFVPCPNQVSNHGSDRGKWLPAANATTATNMRMFEFVGILMGIAMRTKNPFVLDLPGFVWKKLCNDTVSIDDIKLFDLHSYNTYSAILEMSDSESFAALDLKFTMVSSDGRTEELIPGGSNIPVTFNRRDDYLRAFERARLHELDRHCAAIARGLATQVPRNLLTIFSAAELELMVCGPPEVDINLLRSNTVYGEGISESSTSVLLLWEVLEEFSQEDRQRYLRFVWGRSRLPTSSTDWERKHKINNFGKTPSDDYLPVGHTCFFSLDLPQYTSFEVCYNKVLFAISNCLSIDADETAVARQASEYVQTEADDEELEFDV